ncbi:MAG: PAS domain S-box protein [Pseudorhodoplanes sp.]|jgi:PAS domain S-box-containing protein|nr:PAS domain S-box protein [Pseudorhodoplanes sp.]
MSETIVDWQNCFASALLNSRADAMLLCDGEGIIRCWTPGAERLFGYTETEAVGRSLDIIIPERLRARHWAGYREVMNGAPSRYGDGEVLAVPGLRKDGSQLSIEFTITPATDPQNRLVGLAAVIRDVTARFEELKALRKQLRTAAPT